MNLGQVLVLAIVEGVTEFLPVSSTGHLVLLARILGIFQTEFVKSFEIAIQLGAILSVVWLYRRDLAKDWETWKRMLVGFLPTGILGLIFYRVIKNFLLGNEAVTLWALFVGGIVLIVCERIWMRSFLAKPGDSSFNLRDISLSSAFKIGLAQSLSMIPGVSRAGAAIIGGMAVGLSRTAAVEYSFLLAIPTMAAATGLDLIKSGWGLSGGEFGLMGIGFAGSFLVAAATVKWLTAFVKRRTLAVFGWYRILLVGLWWLT